jgi:2-polyprenyl-3-methyl-5-hydroxy-6-metoxy-1,4-benzoquinol methylase
MNPTSEQREERWRKEARFFDEWADRSARSIGPIDPLALRRYSARRLRRRFNKEYRFRVLGPVAGKQVLDVGCGDGMNAVLLAKLGAQVTGIDVSPKAVEVARQRAEVNGVSERTRFLCAPLENADLPPGVFDVIWGDAILHHLIGELDGVLRRLVSWAKPRGLLLFAEPINFNQTLRRIRFLIPVRTEATPDERPLEPAEIRLLRTHIPDLHVEPFTLLGRLDRFLLPGYNYERSPISRRCLANALAMIDYVALRIPAVRNLAGAAVMYGHPRKP